MRNPETIRFWRGNLPHWEVRDGLYFVTIHAAGAVPKAALDKIRSRLDSFDDNDPQNYLNIQRQIFRSIESYLETAPLIRDLEDPTAAGIIADAINYYESIGRWRMIAYVVMPNHVHLFFSTDFSLKKLLQGFKQWTGSKIRKKQGRSGRFWQREWFDHWSRSPEQDNRIICYIRDNPVKAGLVSDSSDWPYLRFERP